MQEEGEAQVLLVCRGLESCGKLFCHLQISGQDIVHVSFCREQGICPFELVFGHLPVFEGWHKVNVSDYLSCFSRLFQSEACFEFGRALQGTLFPVLTHNFVFNCMMGLKTNLLLALIYEAAHWKSVKSYVNFL